MKNEKDTRLYEALDYIDSDLIGETAEKLMLPIPPKKRRISPARIALLAACLSILLLSIHVVMTLAGIETSVVIIETKPPLPFNSLIEDTIAIKTNTYDGSRGLVYQVAEDGSYASLTDIGTCTDTHITVATSYNGVPVTAIRFSALSICKTVESIIIPDTIEEIGIRALADCPQLKKVYIGAGVKIIDLDAFSGSDIEEVVISPDNPYFICRDNCVIEVETKTLILGWHGAVIPDDGSVEKIRSSAFKGKKSITSIVIPEGIKEIGAHAFERCGLESITLPKSIEKLGTGVFSYCRSLKYFDLGGYHELPNYTLTGSDAVIEVVGLENVTKIGYYALNVGDGLRSIKLTSNLNYIAQYACSSASSLGRIYFDGTVDEWNAIPKGYEWNMLMKGMNIFCTDGMGNPKATLPESQG